MPALAAVGYDTDAIGSPEDTLLDPDGAVTIPKSVEAGAELDRLERARETRLEPIAAPEKRLEEQRLREWAIYGQTIKTAVKAAAADIDGLSVPVNVTVDVDTYRLDAALDTMTLEGRLISDAVMLAPTPSDLPGTLLDRLDER